MIIGLIAVFSFSCQAKSRETTGNQLSERSDLMRKPSAAGTFYPSNPQELSGMINKFLLEAPKTGFKGQLIALMVPHAGYVYSGLTAAYAYKLLEAQKYETVIILGPSHRVAFDGVAVYPSGSFSTPLGEIPVDNELADRLMSESSLIRALPQAHAAEHSLEVQLPFLQKTLAPGFKILPIEIYQPNFATCKTLAQALYKVFRPGKNLLLMSTDMSHYHPYETAQLMDKPTMKFVADLSIDELVGHLNRENGELCGEAGVLTGMMMLKAMRAKGKQLHYSTSGETTGDNSQVVGYGAVAFYLPGENKTEKNPEKQEEEVNSREGETLLKIARRTLDAYIEEGKIPPVEEKMKLLDEKRGMFVTLKKGKNQELRGCIGYIFAEKPLRQAVVDLTLASSTQDYRFPPVKPSELKEIKIEISLLSPLKRETNPENIVMGKHGVYVKLGTRSGVFLPQVADETGWDREEFLANLCAHKAGLNPNAWKDPKTEIYTFTVAHFEEKP